MPGGWVAGVVSQGTDTHTHMLVIRGRKSRSLHPPTRILKVQGQALMGFSHVFDPDGHNITLSSQVNVLKTAPNVAMVGRYTF